MLLILGGMYDDLIHGHILPSMRMFTTCLPIPGIADAETKRVRRIPNLFFIDGIGLYGFAERLLDVPVIVNNYCLLGVNESIISPVARNKRTSVFIFCVNTHTIKIIARKVIGKL